MDKQVVRFPQMTLPSEVGDMPARMAVVLLYIGVMMATRLEASAPWKHIPDNMEPFCPSKNICRRNSSTEYPRLDIAEKYQRCCTDCSCDDDCGLVDSCCFPKMNSHPKPNRSLQKCIYPSTLNVNLRSGFYMNTRARKRNTPSATTDTDVDCGNSNVTRFGDLFPVFSMDSKIIYKNPECAKEDGIDDLIFWKTVLQCEIYDATLQKQFSLSQFQIFSVPPPNCRIVFVPPTEIVPLIEKDICYNDVIDTCTREVEMELMTNKEIIDACENGFFSPFLLGNVYANVFCYICNVDYAFLTGENECDTSSSKEIEKSQAGFPSLTTIININGNNEEVATKEKPERIACLRNEQAEQFCRRILCSSGQHYNQHGNCDFVAERLDGLRPKITLSLHPTETMTTSELRNAVERTVSLDSWLHFPWPSTWHVIIAFAEETLYLKSNEREPTVTLVLVVVHEKVEGHVPQKTFDEMSESIRKEAEICTRDRCVMATQSIAEYAEYTTLDDGQSVPDWQEFLSQIDEDKYPFDKKVSMGVNILYLARQFLDSWLNLGKTFLCDQIELEPTEFKLFNNSVLLYVEGLNLMLYDNEFEMYLNENGNYTARVCMKDVGFSEYHVNGGNLLAITRDWIRLAFWVTVATCVKSI